MKFPLCYPVIYAYIILIKYTVCATLSGGDEPFQNQKDLYTVSYHEGDAAFHIQPLGQSLPATLLDLNKGLFIYANEDKACFIMTFPKHLFREPVSNISLKLPIILKKIFGQKRRFYATEKLQSNEKVDYYRLDFLRKTCNEHQIWRLSPTKPNLPTTEEFMQHRRMEIAEENVGSRLSGDSEKKVIMRTRRNTELTNEHLPRFNRRRSRPRTGINRQTRKKIRKSKNLKNIQNDDHFENVIIEDDVPYVSPSFSRQDETGTFRHYLGFNDELETDSYSNHFQTYEKLLPLLDQTHVREELHTIEPNYKETQLVDRNVAILGERETEILDAVRDLKSEINEDASEIQFPKTIVKDGKVFYRHDSDKSESEAIETSILETEPHVVGNTDRENQFQTFADDAQRNGRVGSKIAQQNFNLLLDQMRQIGSQTKITSAAIASAAVRGNSKGSSSHVMGTALNNGYFAAMARGRDSSGILTQTDVMGSGRGSVGSATVVAPNKYGSAHVQVDHGLGGAAGGYSVTQNGDTRISADINNQPKTSLEERLGQSFGEAEGIIHSASEENKFDTYTSSEEPNVNELGQILPGQFGKGSSMIDNIMEEVYKPNEIYAPTYTPEHNFYSKPVFREGYAIDENYPTDGNLRPGHIIDQGGLLVGAGEPPKEGEIQQIPLGILPEGGFDLEEHIPDNTGSQYRPENTLYHIPPTVEQPTDYYNEFENSMQNTNFNTNLHHESVNKLSYVDNSNNQQLFNSEESSTKSDEIYNLHYSQNHTEQNSLQSQTPSIPLPQEHGLAGQQSVHSDNVIISKNSYNRYGYNSWPNEKAESVPYDNQHEEYLEGANYLNQNYTVKSTQSLPTPRINKITSPMISGHDNFSNHGNYLQDNVNNIISKDIKYTHQPHSYIKTYPVPEPEPLPISPLAPKNYSAQLKEPLYKNLSSHDSSLVNSYDHVESYYPDYYEPNTQLDKDSPPLSNLNKNNNLQKYSQHEVLANYNKTISELMANTIPPIANHNMITPSTLVLPVIVPENNIENYDLLEPGEAGSVQTLEPKEHGQPMIKIMTVENNERAKLLYQREGTPIQPGERIPGTPGYRVPPGFRGRIIMGHSQPVEVESRRAVRGYNTRVKLQPHIPLAGPVFASVGGSPLASHLKGNETALHVSLNSYSTPQRASGIDQRHKLSFTDRAGSPRQLVGPIADKKSPKSGKSGQTYQNTPRNPTWERNSYHNQDARNECGHYSNKCNDMQGPYLGASICLPIFVATTCCC